jgi:hypothetical protein
MQIEGVGDAWAEAIVLHRGADGYKTPADLDRIRDAAGKKPTEAVRKRLECLLP